MRELKAVTIKKAKDLIAQELKNIQNGDFSNDEIDLAKTDVKKLINKN